MYNFFIFSFFVSCRLSHFCVFTLSCPVVVLLCLDIPGPFGGSTEDTLAQRVENLRLIVCPGPEDSFLWHERKGAKICCPLSGSPAFPTSSGK